MKNFRKLLVAGAVLGVVVAAAAWPVSQAILSTEKEVYFVEPHKDPAIVKLNREEFWDGSKDPLKVLAIYGVPVDDPIKVVLVSEKKLHRPAENPSVVYYDISKGRPWQAKTIGFVRPYVLGGGVIGAVVCLLGLLLAKAAAPAKGGRSAAAE